MLEDLSGIEVPRPYPQPPPRRREVEVRREIAETLHALFDDETKTGKLTPAEVRLGLAIAKAAGRVISADSVLTAFGIGYIEVDEARDEASRQEEVLDTVRVLQDRLKSEAMQFPFSLLVEATEAVGGERLQGFMQHCFVVAKTPDFYNALGLLLQMVTLVVVFEQKPRNLQAFVEVLETLGEGVRRSGRCRSQAARRP